MVAMSKRKVLDNADYELKAKLTLIRSAGARQNERRDRSFRRFPAKTQGVL
jgi:hypothetical protein